MKKTIQFYGKTSDCFGGVIKVDDKVIKEMDGYPPFFLGDGDGIDLEIDLATGQILNWDAAKVEKEIAEILQEE